MQLTEGAGHVFAATGAADSTWPDGQAADSPTNGRMQKTICLR